LANRELLRLDNLLGSGTTLRSGRSSFKRTTVVRINQPGERPSKRRGKPEHDEGENKENH